MTPQETSQRRHQHIEACLAPDYDAHRGTYRALTLLLEESVVQAQRIAALEDRLEGLIETNSLWDGS